MKKLLSLLLVVAMLLSMSLLLTACGGDADTDTNTDSSVDADTNDTASSASPFPKEFDNVEAVAVKDVQYGNTTWTFAGGAIDGVEMNQDDAQLFLTGCGGSCTIAFSGDEKATIVMGEATETAPCKVVAEGFFLEIKFAKTTYYGAFTLQGEMVVLLLCSDAQPDTVLYMVMDEH